MEQEQIVIHLDSKIITLKYQEFDAEVDLDNLTKIHYENIYGEIVTISALLNKVGQLKADVTNRYAKTKLDFDIYEAGLRKMYKANRTAEGSKATIQDIEDLVLTDPGYKGKKLNLISIQKQMESIDAVYWAVKSKDDKLNNLRNNILPKEFEAEIIEGVVNSIMIGKHDKVVGKVKSNIKEEKPAQQVKEIVDDKDEKVDVISKQEVEKEKKEPVKNSRLEEIRNKFKNKQQ